MPGTLLVSVDIERLVVVGEIVEPAPDLKVRMDPALTRYVVEKGSITVDGCSLTVVEAGDDELMERYGRWYVPRRDPRYLRRNALVALGNVGDPGDARTLAAVERRAAGDDELLAEHAAWALARLAARR